MTPEEIQAALFEPFAPEEVKWKPAVVKDNRALALAYVDARCIMDRLDKVLGISNWQDDFECLPDGSVLCRLKIRIGGEWLVKVDVGGQSEQPDSGDRDKAAHSDALKRAAVKFGIGRYLYRLPQSWVDFDPRTKRIVKPPQLPAWAIPRAKRDTASAADAKPPPTNGKHPEPKRTEQQVFSARLVATDADMVKAGLCQPGELVRHIAQTGIMDGYPADILQWNDRQLAMGKAWARRFRDKRQGERAMGRQPGRDLDKEAATAMAQDMDPYDGE